MTFTGLLIRGEEASSISNPFASAGVREKDVLLVAMPVHFFVPASSTAGAISDNSVSHTFMFVCVGALFTWTSLLQLFAD